MYGPVTWLIEPEDEKVVHRHVKCDKVRFSLVEPVDRQNDDMEELLLLVMSKVSETQAELDTETTQ